ncbi:unnamed protein product [Brachionus calyciflorus]|uniref:Uncharacterized protein n=1 Tax=Brachionus calyciflorus TaxID=104777 RepID=A0A814DZN3_9BILA|nr:unnamed protein product [Brachionus calyciflorus]
MNILNDTVNQLMSEFPDIFEQFENDQPSTINNLNIRNLVDNNSENNINLVPESSFQTGGNLNHFITQTNFGAAIDDIKLAFENLTNEFSSQMGVHDKIRIVLYHDSLESPISIPFMKKTNLTSQVLVDSFERIGNEDYQNLRMQFLGSYYLQRHFLAMERIHLRHFDSGSSRWMGDLEFSIN